MQTKEHSDISSSTHSFHAECAPTRHIALQLRGAIAQVRCLACVCCLSEVCNGLTGSPTAVRSVGRCCAPFDGFVDAGEVQQSRMQMSHVHFVLLLRCRLHKESSRSLPREGCTAEAQDCSVDRPGNWRATAHLQQNLLQFGPQRNCTSTQKHSLGQGRTRRAQ